MFADTNVLVRIRGQFMQTNTETGRLAMAEPSLQTIPRPVEYELAQTQDTADPAAAAGTSAGPLQESNIRAAFVAPPGWVLLGADYRQLELRLMAHFSGDENLLLALGSRGSDPFVNLAANWLGVPHDKVGTEPAPMWASGAIASQWDYQLLEAQPWSLCAVGS